MRHDFTFVITNSRIRWKNCKINIKLRLEGENGDRAKKAIFKRRPRKST